MENNKNKRECLYGRVISIEEFVPENDELVYDLEIEGTHNFVANKLLVSNSSSFSVQSINVDHFSNTYVRIGVTATPFRNDGSDMGLEAILSEVLYEYNNKQAIKDGFLVKPEKHDISFNNLAGKSYQDEYKNSLVLNNKRNKEIAACVSHHANDSVLVLVQQVEHGDILKKMIPKAEFIHGQESDSIRQKLFEDFKDSKIKCLIGTVGVLGEGVNLPNANVLVFACGGKAESGILQAFGRVLRIHPNKTTALIYDFTDEGTNWLHKHYLERKEIFDHYFGGLDE